LFAVTVYISSHKKKVQIYIISAPWYAANKWPGFKNTLLCRVFFLPKEKHMEIGKLYFVKDEFYQKFKNCGLLENKETINGKPHQRPCCYLFKFDDSNIYWMIPVSSKIEKYEYQYQHSMEKYGMCDNISFGYVLGKKNAFLPQNMFPITAEYISNIYLDPNTKLPIGVNKKLMAELNAKARKKFRYNQQGKKFGLTDIMKIYHELLI